jgi:hypothetical protein
MMKLAAALYFSLVLVAGVPIWSYVLANPIAPIIPAKGPHPFPFDRRWIILGGGPEHRVFLGSLNRGRPGERLAVEESIGHNTGLGAAAWDSIFAQMQDYGSANHPYSISNRDSQYGTPHGPYSACDRAAANPPILINESGEIAGILTLNPSLPGRIQHAWILEQLEHLCQ